jgi:hypothetical protein
MALEERVVEMSPEWGGIIPTQVFLDEGKRLASEAEKRGIPIRLLGGVAIRMHCSEFLDFANKLTRLSFLPRNGIREATHDDVYRGNTKADLLSSERLVLR